MKKLYLISSSFLADVFKNILYTILLTSIIVFLYTILSIGEIFVQKEKIIKECRWEDSIICYFPFPNINENSSLILDKVQDISGVISCTFLPIEYDFVDSYNNSSQNLFLVEDLGNVSDKYPLNIIDGRYPDRDTNEIVLNESVYGLYHIGDTLFLTNPITQKSTTLTIVGFVSDETILPSNGSKPGNIAAYAAGEVSRNIYLDGIFSNSPTEIAMSYYLSNESTNVICLGNNISMNTGEYIKEEYINPYFLLVNCNEFTDIDSVISELNDIFDDDAVIASVNSLLRDYREDNRVVINRFILYLIGLVCIYIILIGINLYNKILAKTEELNSYYICGCGYFKSVLLSLSGYFVSVILGIIVSLPFIMRQFNIGIYTSIIVGIVALNVGILLISIYFFRQQNDKIKANK